MDDDEKRICRKKREFQNYPLGKLRIIADEKGLDYTERAAAFELLHEADMAQTSMKTKQSFRLSILALIISLMGTLWPIARDLFFSARQPTINVTAVIPTSQVEKINSIPMLTSTNVKMR